MAQPFDSREVSSASEMEVPSLQAEGSTSVSDDEGGWQTCSSRSRCRRPKWTREEEMVLVEAHCTLGNAWVAIAECLPGRTPSEVKNIWHSTLRARKLQTRSVLRAYVTALKDRADKPSARQQAMRAAQHFLKEAGGKASPPSRRVYCRIEAQQPKLRAQADAADASSAPSPTASPALSEPEVVERAVDADAAVDGAAGPPAAPLVASAAGPAAGHRASLGSEWSCMACGVTDSWPQTTTGGSTAVAAAAPQQVISFSPLVASAAGGPATYTVPPLAGTGGRASAGSVVTTTITTSAAGSRCFDSPSFRSYSPSLPVMQPPPEQHIAAAAAADSDNSRTVAAFRDYNGSTATAAWLAASESLALAVGSGQSQQPQAAMWQQAAHSHHTAAALPATAITAAWDLKSIVSAAATPPTGYVVSTGDRVSVNASRGDLRSLWMESDLGELAASQPKMQSGSPVTFLARMPAAGAGVVTAAGPASSLARSPANIAAQLRGSVPTIPSPFSGFKHGIEGGLSGSGGGVAGAVTLGLYGITDAELLACLEA